MTRWVPFHDLVAGVVTLVLLVGILLHSILGQAIPEVLSTAFTVAITWTFRGAIQLQNELRHRNEVKNGS